jgi:uncharacterized oligopeptide transporter (OPT) family protein
VDHWHRKHSPGADHEQLKQNGMLYAAGLITGEALVGIFIALCIWAKSNPDVLVLGRELPLAKWGAAAMLVGVCYWIYRAGTPRRQAA